MKNGKSILRWRLRTSIILCFLFALSSTHCAPSILVPSCYPQLSPYGGGSGTASDPYLICSVAQFQNVDENLDANFLMTTDIDLTNTNFTPIGSAVNFKVFSGVFDGANHTLSNWTYLNPSVADDVGLFSTITGTIKNLISENFNVNVTTAHNTGLLVGSMSGSAVISNCTVSGGLQSITNGVPVGTGGIAGRAGSTSSSIATMIYSSSSANVSSDGRTGQLAGISSAINISYSHATGNVTCTPTFDNRCGGLIGETANGVVTAVSNSYYSLGTVFGTNGAGGLVGQSGYPIYIVDSYMTGTVSANINSVGGIIGYANGSIPTNLTRVFAAGKLVGGTVGQIGGVIGYSYYGQTSSSISYWDIQITGQSTNADSGSSGESTTAMQTQSSYVGWDFEKTWYPPVLGQSYPTLR